MKELSFIMFLFGCGYVIARFFNRFTVSGTRQLNFYIPSAADYNIIWGFIFYLGFIALYVTPFFKVFALLAIVFLFGLLLYFKGLSRYLQSPQSAFFKQDILRRLKKQQDNDACFNKPYTRQEALRVLGLPSNLPNGNPQIEKQFALIENLAAANSDTPYLKLFITELRSALK